MIFELFVAVRAGSKALLGIFHQYLLYKVHSGFFDSIALNKKWFYLELFIKKVHLSILDPFPDHSFTTIKEG